MKYLLLLPLLFILSGCGITDQQCKQRGYTHTVQNAFHHNIGCAKVNNHTVTVYEYHPDRTHMVHITEAPPLYLFKEQ